MSCKYCLSTMKTCSQHDARADFANRREEARDGLWKSAKALLLLPNIQQKASFLHVKCYPSVLNPDTAPLSLPLKCVNH